MKVFSLIILGIFCLSCGVKGKPLPPLVTPAIGDGKPMLDDSRDKAKEKASEKR